LHKVELERERERDGKAIPETPANVGVTGQACQNKMDDGGKVEEKRPQTMMKTKKKTSAVLHG
jgi:hypothetical protein